MANRRQPPAGVSAVNPKILRVAREMSKKLTFQGIQHALIGGLAVNARGYARATSDVDFLIAEVSRQAVAGNDLGGEVEGKTVKVSGVQVDFLFPKRGQSFLNREVSRAEMIREIPTITTDVLIYLKLLASRARDQGDVVELLKLGKVDVAAAKSLLQKHRPDLVDDFEAMVLQAEYEPR